MNQIFSTHRFGRYLRFVLSMNRWYYGVLFVFFVIPALVLSICKLDNEISNILFCLIAMPIFCLALLPNIDLSRIGGWARQISVPASWLEKLIVEFFVRFSMLAITFCILLFSSNGKMACDIHGFSLADFSYILLWVAGAFFATNFRRERLNECSINLMIAVFMGITGYNIVYFSQRVFTFSSVLTCVMLSLSAAMFIGAILTYKRKRIK